MLAGKMFKTMQKQIFATRAALPFFTLSVGVMLAIASSKPASAAGVVGNGTPESCTEGALNTALTGGGNVYFNCGSNPHTIRVTSEKVISSKTLIDGLTNGQSLITLSGGKQNRIFVTNDSVDFTVKNITIADWFTSNQGGGIFSGYRGKLTVKNCKFLNNTSTQGGQYDGGGAIYTKSESTIDVEDSEFTGNKADNGGAIHNLLSDLTIINSKFSGNQSVHSSPNGNGGGGGAIYIDSGNGNSGKIIIRNSTFSDNTAVAQGGAIFLQLYDNNTTAFENLIFSNNSATGNGNQGFGGGIFYVGRESTTSLSVTNTAIYGNKANNQGGGIWSGSNANVTITNTTISDNQATNGNGGGIMRTSGKLSITNSTIAGNSAGFQGGGIVAGGESKITNVIIANNVAKNGGNNWNIKNNCTDTMASGGNNLQYPGKNANDSSDKDCAAGITTADPKLGDLANNGGSTPTRALLSGSAAIDTGNNGACPSVDQRYYARPKGGGCDIGAFEVQ